MSVAEQSALYNREDYQTFAEAEHSVPELPDRHREWIQFIEHNLNRHNNARFERQKPRLLDIGCGAADFLSVARQMGYELS